MYLYPGKVSILLKENVAPLKQGRHCWSVSGVTVAGCYEDLGLGEVYSPQ